MVVETWIDEIMLFHRNVAFKPLSHHEKKYYFSGVNTLTWAESYKSQFWPSSVQKPSVSRKKWVSYVILPLNDRVAFFNMFSSPKRILRLQPHHHSPFQQVTNSSIPERFGSQCQVQYCAILDVVLMLSLMADASYGPSINKRRCRLDIVNERRSDASIIVKREVLTVKKSDFTVNSS